MLQRSAMDGVLDLSAKTKSESDHESNDERTSSTPRDVLSPDVHKNISSSNSPLSSQESINRSIPSTYPPTPNPMFYPNYSNYSLIANSYLALQHQMISSMMANQMHPAFPWMFPGNIPSSMENKKGDMSAFYHKFPHGGMPRFPTDMLQPQVPSNHPEFSVANDRAESLKRRLSSEVKKENPSSDGSTSSFERNKPPRKKLRSKTADSSSDVTPSVQPVRTPSASSSQKSRMETLLNNCEDSSDSRYERNLQSDCSNESCLSSRSGDESLHSSNEHKAEFADNNSYLNQSETREAGSSNVQDYKEKRRKNNVAAKKSRDQRRMQEESINRLANQLREENGRLRNELLQLKTRSSELEKFLGRRKELAANSKS